MEALRNAPVSADNAANVTAKTLSFARPASVENRETTSQDQVEVPAVERQADEPLPKPAETKDFSQKELQQLGERVESALNRGLGTAVRFGVTITDPNKESLSLGDLRFKIVDKDTGKVVREFPPGKLFEIAERMDRDQRSEGILVDDTI